MTQTGRLRTGTKKLKAMSVTHIGGVFGHWVKLPKDFGHAVRHRLFSPLTCLLALPLSGPYPGDVLQGDAAKLSRMVGW